MCAGLSDAFPERRPALGSRGSFLSKRVKFFLVFSSEKLLSKETREKACLFWLLMLYYKGGRLNGLWCPFGIETPFGKSKHAIDGG